MTVCLVLFPQGRELFTVKPTRQRSRPNCTAGVTAHKPGGARGHHRPRVCQTPHKAADPLVRTSAAGSGDCLRSQLTGRLSPRRVPARPSDLAGTGSEDGRHRPSETHGPEGKEPSLTQ